MQTQLRTIENIRAIGHRPTTGRSKARKARWTLTAGALALSLGLAGCVSQGDFLRLKEEVAAQHRGGRGDPDPFARIAQLSNEVDSMREEIRQLKGELELARKESSDALAEIQRTRTSLARQSRDQAEAGGRSEAGSNAGASGGATGSREGAAVAATPKAPAAPAPPDQELDGYQEALDAWRSDDYLACIEHFTSFLQSYPTSGYADDAAYWLADCTYKHEEYKRAVIRFSDVVRVYPDSPKAPDALYRQGESLLKLGPRFKDAARTVFKRVQSDYPESERAQEATLQLERLGPSS